MHFLAFVSGNFLKKIQDFRLCFEKRMDFLGRDFLGQEIEDFGLCSKKNGFFFR